MNEEYQIVPKVTGEVSPASIEGMLDLVRPIWRGRGLIKRVERLLKVDPSSACQRLFNAAIYDLREKVVTIGVDIAKEVAKTYKLPPIEKDEDILENYSTSNIIDLSYRIGILTRSEWRRVQRCYEIRKDLEHEDNEYQAVLEDCFYIFKSTIEVVLSQDPIELIRVKDIKQLVEQPQRVTVSDELLADYDHAPELRQNEIISSLISIIRDDQNPDIVRANSFEMLRHFKTRTKTHAVMEAARRLEKKLGRDPIDLVTAKVAHAIGATAYFKRTKIVDFYTRIVRDFGKVGTDWGKQAECAALFHDIGHFAYCPQEMIKEFIRHLVSWYIGEPGGYGYFGRNRAVFYSNGAVPIIKRIIEYSPVKLVSEIEELRDDKKINRYLGNKHILARFEDLIDFAEKKK